MNDQKKMDETQLVRNVISARSSIEDKISVLTRLGIDISSEVREIILSEESKLSAEYIKKLSKEPIIQMVSEIPKSFLGKFDDLINTILEDVLNLLQQLNVLHQQVSRACQALDEVDDGSRSRSVDLMAFNTMTLKSKMNKVSQLLGSCGLKVPNRALEIHNRIRMNSGLPLVD